MSGMTNGKVTVKKRPIQAGATPLLAVHPPKSFVGSLPAVTQEA